VARADAQTWINGLAEFGNFEFVTWELNQAGVGLKRLLRHIEYLFAPISVRLVAKRTKPDMVMAERTTSYGFLAAVCGVKPIAVAQQGITDIYPLDSAMLPIKEFLQNYAFKKADIIHAWGPAMAESMKRKNVEMSKVLILPKGINLDSFFFNDEPQRYTGKIKAIVTRSLLPDYRYETIIKAFHLLKQRGLAVELMIAGSGYLRGKLQELVNELDLNEEVKFLGRLNNIALPNYLNECNYYISMPITEGVSASLFEAMACGCFPVVSDLPGNQSWINNGENGMLVTVDDVEGLANAIITSWHQEEHRKQVARTNRKFIEEYANYAVNMKKIAQSYLNLIEKSKP
ncbi:MAG TPA: glycosyltransferase, partial [Phnomibacter sp.]|nr:glycosyltransferase [Phnomibacter sp.]